MKAARHLAAVVVVGCCVVGVTGSAQRASGPAASPAPQTAPKPADKFDPARNADADIQAAVAEAKKSKRRVILDVGGEWCGWCHALDRYFVEHKDLTDLRDRLYVWVKVNYSTENKNEAVLSRYPKIPGYPHLFVLDQDGKLVQSQGTSELEEGSSYNLDRMQQFLMRWSGGSK
jgi:thiol:disulfide interchange protein